MNPKLLATTTAGLLCLAGGLAACGSDPSSSGSGAAGADGVGVFLSTSANSYEQAQAAGVKKAAQDLGAGDVQVFDASFDSTAQIGQVQDAVTSGRFKSFVIEPVDGAAIAGPLARAAAAGIEVVCVTSACGPDATKIDLQVEGQGGVVASDYGQVAEAMAGHAVEACEGVDPCRVFFLNGDSTFPSDRAAKDSFAGVMEKAPSNVEFVGTQDGKYDTVTGRSVMQSELQRNPDLDVLVSFADQQTLGAAQAIDAASKSEQVKIISFGGSEQAVAAVKNGAWLGSMLTLPFSIGETGATIAIQLAQGKTPDETVVDASTLAPVDGAYLIKDNAADFTAQWTS
ncbi:sugar ABC transporter substrate-binding protein [Nocardioides sp. W7]|uniref:sugar ABC transporter substrate-binding protein n=1 Tax=Nocardioides sp. W7 TaxID=2931390 RepID=UPI001FD43564|nr:sugar ABC transporter substrate-binding protein [Nocardioides sp. W7]